MKELDGELAEIKGTLEEAQKAVKEDMDGELQS